MTVYVCVFCERSIAARITSVYSAAVQQYRSVSKPTTHRYVVVSCLTELLSKKKPPSKTMLRGRESTVEDCRTGSSFMRNGACGDKSSIKLCYRRSLYNTGKRFYAEGYGGDLTRKIDLSTHADHLLYQATGVTSPKGTFGFVFFQRSLPVMS